MKESSMSTTTTVKAKKVKKTTVSSAKIGQVVPQAITELQPVVVATRVMNKNFTLAAGQDLKPALCASRVFLSVPGSGIMNEVTLSEYVYPKTGKKIYARRTGIKPGQTFKDIKHGDTVQIIVIK